MIPVRPAMFASLILGIAIGIGSYTFVYAKGASYLSNDPEVCANCHIMEEHFAAWTKSSHRNAATCNDCHTPKGVVAKYATKASNGFWHSFAFTTGDFPDPLRIKPHNHEITENACRKCHQQVTREIDTGIGATAPDPHYEIDGAALRCTHCHQYTGHWVR
mgnify:CR=1 FL=1